MSYMFLFARAITTEQRNFFFRRTRDIFFTARRV